MAFWAGNSIQRVAFPLTGHRINPTKYAAEVAQAGALSEMAWLGAWTSTLLPGGQNARNVLMMPGWTPSECRSRSGSISNP